MKNIEQFKSTLAQLLSNQKLAVLCTHHDGQPYASLVAFASSSDLKELYFMTSRATRKFTYLQANPKVAMLIDNRSNRDEDIDEAIAVTAMGSALEVSRENREQVLQKYLAKHPHLREFAQSKETAAVQVRVDTYYLVSRFQQVVELHSGDWDNR